MTGRVFLMTLVVAGTAIAAEPRIERLSDVCRVAMKDRKLDVTLVGKTDVKKEELIAIGDEQWTLTPQPGGGFELACEDRKDDRWSDAHVTSITRSAASLAIAGVGRAGNSFVSVEYTQDNLVGGEVRLLVQRARRMRARPLDDDKAADTVTLFADHQPQMRMYVMPLLDELSTTNPLRPGAADVYRAFGTIAADADVSAKVKSLLAALDSDLAAERDAAMAKIEALGRPGVLAVMRLDQADFTPEQAARLDALVARNSIWPDPKAARKDMRFLTDCLLDDDTKVCLAAKRQLHDLTGREIAIDLNVPPASRRETVAQLLDAIETGEAQPASDTR